MGLMKHTYRFWAIFRSYALTVEEETDALGFLALTITKGVHQLLKSSGTLDLEEDLVLIVRNFNVEVFGNRRVVCLSSLMRSTLVMIGHFEEYRCLWGD